MEPKAKAKDSNRMEKVMEVIEVIGNKLPHPFFLFIFLSAITVVLSGILSAIGWSADYPTVVDGVVQTTNVSVVNLMNLATLSKYLQNYVSIFINYYPLGMVVVMVVGVSYAEKLGLFDAMMRKAVIGAPLAIVFMTVAFVGVNSSIGSGAGVIFTMVIAAAVFKAMGLHPWIGIIMGYAAANGGFTACLFPTSVDTFLAGLSSQIVAADGIADAAGNAPATHALVNYYFMVVATFVMTAACFIVTKYIVAPYINRQYPELQFQKDSSELDKMRLTADENRGLKYAGITAIVYLVLLVLICIPKNSFMRAEDGTLVPSSPLLNMIIPLLFLFFMAIGTAYGIGAKTLHVSKDVPATLETTFAMVSSFLTVCLTASVFVNLFSESKIASVLAAKGAAFLTKLNVGNVTLFILMILLSCFINIFMTSNSGKWVMVAPLFVPMLAMLGVSPAMTQILYRIGDSTFNIISPVETNLPIALGLLESYKVRKEDKVGIGTLISMEIPYTVLYLILLIILVLVFYFLDLPLGPGAPIFLR